MSGALPDTGGRPARGVWIRAGQVIGLLFLAGPIRDLVESSAAGARVAAIAVVLAAFVALYLVLLPPPRALERRGGLALPGGVAVLAALAGIVIALGAPESFTLMLVYVVVAAGLLLAPRIAVTVTVTAALAAGTGLALAGSQGATVATYVLTIVAIGTMMVVFADAARTNRKLRAARGELAQVAVTEERLRIARDLHDVLGHTLSLIALKSDLATRLVTADPARAEAEMTEVQQVTRQALTEVRAAVQGYGRLAFADALAGARAALTAAGIECRVEGEPTAGLPEDVESVLAWTVREATTNVVRHSGARACAITLSTDAGGVALEVRDDGTGAARGEDGRPAAPGESAADGAGLAGLAERARRLHGALEAEARPGQGFRVRLTLPLGTA